MTTLLITHPVFVEHDTGLGHPERPDRMRAIDKVLSHELFNGLKREEAPLREDVEEMIALAHPQSYIDWVKAQRPAEGQPPAHLDPDTLLSSTSWEPALRAVGAGLAAVDRVMDKSSGIANVFAQVRPCGHHAEVERAMGFCIFNNIAIAGLYARKKYGCERIAVVDFDVHHGNGTQDIFWSDGTCSSPPPTRCRSIPAPARCRRRASATSGTRRSGPATAATHSRRPSTSGYSQRLRNFGPDIVLISAGFDAHKDDPLANLQLTEPDFAWATAKVAEIAAKHAEGRVVSMLEGGYNLTALARSVGVHVRALMQAGVVTGPSGTVKGWRTTQRASLPRSTPTSRT